MNLESGRLYIQSINLQIKLFLHTLTPSFRPHYRAIIIDRVRQRAISCEGRSEGLVINQLDSDEDLPPPLSLIHIRGRLSSTQVHRSYGHHYY